MADFDVDLLPQEEIDDEEDDLLQDDKPISQIDSWVVIKAYFDEKGLVRQQLDSFDQFITNTITEVVEETPVINLKPQPQYGPGAVNSEVRGPSGPRAPVEIRSISSGCH